MKPAGSRGVPESGDKSDRSADSLGTSHAAGIGNNGRVVGSADSGEFVSELEDFALSSWALMQTLESHCQGGLDLPDPQWVSKSWCPRQ